MLRVVKINYINNYMPFYIHQFCLSTLHISTSSWLYSHGSHPLKTSSAHLLCTTTKLSQSISDHQHVNDHHTNTYTNTHKHIHTHTHTHTQHTHNTHTQHTHTTHTHTQHTFSFMHPIHMSHIIHPSIKSRILYSKRSVRMT